MLDKTLFIPGMTFSKDITTNVRQDLSGKI